MGAFRDELVAIYRHQATGRYGLSSVSQLQHALQSADLAQAARVPEPLVVAALLHDVGHLIHDLGEDAAVRGIDDCHEQRGARWLAQGFGAAVTAPIHLHVLAKRCLVAIEPSYHAALAEDAARSLALQGGPMSAAELSDFLLLPQAQEAVQLRRFDDLAKDPQRQTPPFEAFLPLLDRVLADHPTREGASSR
jgi:phosphonate degradation associated HDIG domain protein